MSLWGNKDLVYDAGTIAVNLTSKIATGAVGWCCHIYYFWY
jgi:hypothetical protein